MLAGLAAGSVAAIALIWVGYPLVVWGTGLLFARPLRPARTAGAQRHVSVILATRDSADVVRARVENLLDTSHPADRLQVVVALDADGARTTVAELAVTDPRVLVVRGDAPGGKASTLNAGVRAANGDVLVMADAQQRFDADTIPELVASLEDPRFAAVSGALTLGGRAMSPVHAYWSLEKWLRFHEARLHSSVGVTGAVYATRRSTWPVLPAGTLLDDVFVPMSLVMAGHRVGFCRTAIARDVRAFDAEAEGTRKTRTLTGVLQLRRLIPGLMSPVRNPVFVQFVAHKLLRLLTPLFAATFAASIALLGTLLFLDASGRVQVLTVASLALLLAIPPVRRLVVGSARWAYAMQVATVRATMNGMRDRWQVWSR